MDIVLTSNSPGEVAGWVKPAAKEMKKGFPDSNISVFLPPCVFASGSEKRVLQTFSTIDNVYGKKEYIRFILTGKKPDKFNPDKDGIVVFLGGDLFHAVLLGKRLNYPVIAYTEGVYNRSQVIKKFMVPDQNIKGKLIKKGAPLKKIKITGNLMFDAIEPEISKTKMKELIGLNQEFVVTLFPGSRPAEIEYMLPFFLNTIIGLNKVNKDNSNFKFLLSRSPFVKKKMFEDIIYKYFDNNNINGKLDSYDKKYTINIEDRIEIDVYAGLQYSLMQITDLALTIPGTNNLELAFFSIPMLVVLPLNKPENIPLEGLVGLIGRAPFIGKQVLRYVVPRIESRMENVSLINRIARKKIVPEIRGVLKPSDLVHETDKIIKNQKEQNRMKNELKKVAGDRGAAVLIVDIMRQVLAVTE